MEQKKLKRFFARKSENGEYFQKFLMKVFEDFKGFQKFSKKNFISFLEKALKDF